MNRNPVTRFEVLRRALAPAAAVAVLLGGQALASPYQSGGRQPLSSDRRVAHMTRQLTLTDAQAKQIKQVLDSHQNQEAAQAQALKSAREALHQAASATSVNEGAIRNAAAALGQAEGDAALLSAQVHAQILPLLTSDQQQKFAHFREGSFDGWKSHSFGAND
jgi:Spy/CpxP family protein refolding chaperone